MTCSEANFNRLILFFLEMQSFVKSTRLFKFISLRLREIVLPWYFNAKVSLYSFRDSGFCRKSILFLFITNPFVFTCSSFLGLPGGFLASHGPVSSGFLEILWIILLDFPWVFEIFPIESLSSLRNLTISFLSSDDVKIIFALFTMQEPVNCWCNLVKYPILYSYLIFFFNTAK